MSQILIQAKSLGIPGVPPSIDTLLQGSMYAAMLDSVPAHLSLIIQALKSNLAAGNPCVLVTRMSPGEFLSRAATAGVDFREDLAQNRLYLFSHAGNCTTNIFRHGIKRFLLEFDYFEVPKGSFILFDQAEEFFTMNDEHMAQTQAMDYRDWMTAMENTSLFLFHARDEKKSQPMLSCFNGVVEVNQSKSGIELLVDFWYSPDGAIAAKAFPVSLDTTGLISVDPALPQTARETAGVAYQAASSGDDRNTVFYLGPDFASFSAAIHHPRTWIQAQNFVDLLHLSRDASRATIVISLSGDSDLQQTAKIVHYLRLHRGNRLKIVIRESGFSLRYLNELFLLRFGANLIIHQQTDRQQLSLLWEMLAGQTYSRRINPDFDLALSSMHTSSHKGYVDLVTFCNESLSMFERRDILDIPLVLIIARYHEQASPPDILKQIKTVRNGDIFSSDATHCYIFIHACAEENSAAALSRLTEDKQSSLFLEIRYITAKESMRETLQSLVQSGNIAVAPDFSEAIQPLNRTQHKPGKSNKAYNPERPIKSDRPIKLFKVISSTPPSLGVRLNSNKTELNADASATVPGAGSLTTSSTAIAQPSSCAAIPEAAEKPGVLASLMNHLASPGTFAESARWPQK